MRSARTTVLLIPAGSGMAVAAIQALRDQSSIQLIGADMDSLAAGMHLADRAYIIPHRRHPKFFPRLFEIVEKESVDLVIPTLDSLLIPISRIRAQLSNLGAKLLASPTPTIRITRDKWRTYQLCKEYVAVPRSWIHKEAIESSFPLFIKPRRGSGSIDAFRVNDHDDLDFYFRKVESPIIQEFLGGTEYTVDCLADERGDLVISIPRTRLEVKAGVCTKSQIVRNDRLNAMATKIASLVRFSGPFFFQAKDDRDGIPHLIEINARLSGTMSLSSASGWNMHLNAVRLALGQPICTAGSIKYGTYLSRYWTDIYLDEKDVVGQPAPN